MTDLVDSLRDISGSLDTTAVEDGRWTEKAQAALAEAVAEIERLRDYWQGDLAILRKRLNAAEAVAHRAKQVAWAAEPREESFRTHYAKLYEAIVALGAEYERYCDVVTETLGGFDHHGHEVVEDYGDTGRTWCLDCGAALSERDRFDPLCTCPANGDGTLFTTVGCPDSLHDALAKSTDLTDDEWADAHPTGPEPG